MICKNCKTVNSDDAVYCRHCGSELKPKSGVHWLSCGVLLFVIALALIPSLIPWGHPIANNPIDEDVTDTALVEVDTISANEESEENFDEDGAPLSLGEKEDGKGGFDDNAEGYFSMYADQFITDNHDVYFEGYFENSKGTYPIMLKFELDDNWNVEICYYHNIDYGTKLKMNVRFTEEAMIIRGKAGECDFLMKFMPTIDGKWHGTAQCGNSYLNASIVPVKR